MSRHDQTPVVWAYTGVSTSRQSLANQEHEILRYADDRGWVVKHWRAKQLSRAVNRSNTSGPITSLQASTWSSLASSKGTS